VCRSAVTDLPLCFAANRLVGAVAGANSGRHMRIFVLVVALVVLSLAVVLASADYRWRSQSTAFVERLERGVAAAPRSVYSPAELEGLPAPVVRYFRAVLRDGQPLVRSGHLVQKGEFLVRPKSDGWRPFGATQHFAARPQGFVWDARIHMAPAFDIRVRDAFIDGSGSMRASVLGLFTMLDVHGKPEIAAGALHRYLAEATWFPTALLPSQGVVWTPIDNSSARATLTVARTTVWLDFHFGADGLVRSVFTPDRARDVNGRGVSTPWQGRWFEYEEHGGMRIPVRGEVEWILSEGPQVYWRGRITEISYE
jgi:hypothetical protein